MMLTNQYILSLLPKRDREANKGTFGKVLVVAGSANYPGAAYLCCAAAYRVGAGLVTLTAEREVKTVVSRKLPEVTFLSFSEVFEKLNYYDVVLLGPGLGQRKNIAGFVKQLLKKNLPKTVIDGDGLNILAKMKGWWKKLNGEMVLTPHPGELSRLTGLTIDEIQSDRETIAKKLAKKWRQVLVLKGANTIVVSPAGQVRICPFANPALATAGTGDILAGMIAGFLAQGLSCFDGACCGVYIHGMAGEVLREKIGDAGVLASDLLPVVPKVIRKLK